MKKMKLLVLLATCFTALGCATSARQTEALLKAPPSGLPEFHEIHHVNFIDQGAAFCGPASLTMAMAWAGEPVKVEEITKEVYTSAMQGSFQEDLISSARRHGLLAIPIKDMTALLTEVSSNHPVIVLQNLSVSWLPRWHYSVVLGYDLKEQEVIMHSGHTAFERVDLKKFERSWALGEYWGLVVLPAGSLAPAASEEDHIAAALGLEQAEKVIQAEASYRTILKRWPTSLVALIGLANLVYENGRHDEAVQLLKKAVQSHPESEEARYNLKIAESML